MFLILGTLFLFWELSHGQILKNPTRLPTPAPTFSHYYPLPTPLCLNSSSVCIDQVDFNLISIYSMPSYYIPPTGLSVVVNQLHGNGLIITDSASLLLFFNATIYFNGHITSDGLFPTGVVQDNCYVGQYSAYVKKGLLPVLIPKAKFQKAICGLALNVTKDLTLKMSSSNHTVALEIIESKPSIPPNYDSNFINWGQKLFTPLTALSQSPLPICLENAFPSVYSSYFAELLSLATNHTGSISIDLNTDPTVIGNRNSTLNLQSLTISGLDTALPIIFQSVPTSNASLFFEIGFQSLEIELGLHLIGLNGTLDTDIDLTLELKNFTFGLTLLAAINQTQINGYYMDQILTGACKVAAIRNLSITSLDVNISRTQLAITSIRSQNPFTLAYYLDQLINNLFLVATEGFSDLVTELVAGLFMGPVREELNAALARSIKKKLRLDPCLPHQTSTEPGYFVWANVSKIQMINSLVDETVGPTGVNKLLTCLTQGTGGLSLNISGTPVNVTGLNSFKNLSMLNTYPSSDDLPYSLHSFISLGACQSNSSSCNPLTLSLLIDPSQSHFFPSMSESLPSTEVLHHSFFPPSSIISPADFASDLMMSNIIMGLTSSLVSHALKKNTLNEASNIVPPPVPPGLIQVTVKMENLEMTTSSLVESAKSIYYNLKFAQTKDRACLASTLNTLQITELKLNLTSATILINDGARIRSVTNAVQFIMEAVPTLLVNQINSQIATALLYSAEVCATGTYTPPVDTKSSSSSSTQLNEWQVFGITWGVLLLVVILLFGFYGAQSSQARQKDDGTVLKDSLIQSQPQKEEFLGSSLFYYFQMQDAMVFHNGLNIWWRLIPFAAGVPLFFLQSNYEIVSSSLIIELNINIGSITIPSVTILNNSLTVLLQSINDSGNHFLAAILGIGTGVFPMLNVSFILYAWLTPLWLFPLKYRDLVIRSLLFVCAVGLSSLVSSFFTAPGDNYDILLSPPSQPSKQLHLLQTFTPGTGFLEVSLNAYFLVFLNAYTLLCHRYLYRNQLFLNLPFDNSLDFPTFDAWNQLPASSLLTSSFDLSRSTIQRLGIEKKIQESPLLNPNFVTVADRVLFQVSRLGRGVMLLLLTAVTVFLIVGITTNTFSYQLVGFIGWLNNPGTNPGYLETRYSLISLATVYTDGASSDPSSALLAFLEATFCLFVIIVPLILVVFFWVIWLFPLKLKDSVWVLMLAEILRGLSMVEYNFIICVLTMGGVESLTQYTLGTACDSVNIILAKYFNTQLEGNDVCFGAQGNVLPNIVYSYVMVSTFFVMSLLTLFFGWTSIASRFRQSSISYLASKSIQSNTTPNPSPEPPTRQNSFNISKSEVDFFTSENQSTRPSMGESSTQAPSTWDTFTVTLGSIQRRIFDLEFCFVWLMWKTNMIEIARESPLEVLSKQQI